MYPHVQPQQTTGPSAGGAQPELQAADMVRLLQQYQQYTGMPDLTSVPAPPRPDAAAAPASALAVAPRVPSSSGSDNAAASQAQLPMPPSTGSGSPSHRHRGRVKQTHQTAQKRYRDRQRVRSRRLVITSHTCIQNDNMPVMLRQMRPARDHVFCCRAALSLPRQQWRSSPSSCRTSRD